jgi:hypothetical protein
VPLYTSALAHEVSHVIDAFGVEGSPPLKARREALIQQAGQASLNYLRSMFPSGFFQGAPQEFVASISNQWFARSEMTLQVGAARFDTGRPEPLNQALFMAEIFSQGTSTALFTTTSAGVLGRLDATIARDVNGHINRIVTPTLEYAFVRAANGNVSSYEATPR